MLRSVGSDPPVAQCFEDDELHLLGEWLELLGGNTEFVGDVGEVEARREPKEQLAGEGGDGVVRVKDGEEFF